MVARPKRGQSRLSPQPDPHVDRLRREMDEELRHLSTDDDCCTSVRLEGERIGVRQWINFHAGDNITITCDDDPQRDEVDITIEADGAAGAPADAPFVTYSATGALSAERVLSNGTGTTINTSVAGQIAVDCTVTQYTNEMAQDAVGGVLTDSSTVDFTYNDGANTITAAVISTGLAFVDVQSQTTSGAGAGWTKPTSFTPRLVHVIAYGAGGGGGGGYGATASATSRTGGAGGGGGSRVDRWYLPSDLGGTESWSVGAGGSGGAGGSSGVGSPGNNGGNTTFSSGATLLTAFGGGGGDLGASNTAAAGGSGAGTGEAGTQGSGIARTQGGRPGIDLTTAGQVASGGRGGCGEAGAGGTYSGGAEYGGAGGGGAVGNAAGATDAGGSSIYGGCGGACGGSTTSTPTVINAKDGGLAGTITAGGGAVGGTSGVAPTNGAAGADGSVYRGGGGGGGGGCSITVTTNGALGGAGGACGGGGGGGGSGNARGGQGGSGGAGGIFVITYG